MTAPPLYIVEGANGITVGLGPRQALWLEEGGFIERTDNPHLWRALHGLTSDDVNKLVMSQAALRECDFCRESPAGWRVNCRPFTLNVDGPYRGARMGGPDRPLFACDVCVRYIRENRKRQLVEYAIATAVEKAKTMGGEVAQIANTQPWQRVKAHLTPFVREVVYGMFAHRIGRPERDDDTTQEAA